MKNAAMVLLASALVTSPVQAADWRSQTTDVRPGAFVGARVQIPLGGRAAARPRASLTLAPTMSRISSTGMVRTEIGDGLALSFGPRSRPELTLGGIRADTALGLHRNGDPNAGRKHGVSAGGWVAIGLGSAAIVAGGLYLAAVHIANCDEGECD